MKKLFTFLLYILVVFTSNAQKEATKEETISYLIDYFNYSFRLRNQYALRPPSKIVVDQNVNYYSIKFLKDKCKFQLYLEYFEQTRDLDEKEVTYKTNFEKQLAIIDLSKLDDVYMKAYRKGIDVDGFEIFNVYLFFEARKGSFFETTGAAENLNDYPQIDIFDKYKIHKKFSSISMLPISDNSIKREKVSFLIGIYSPKQSTGRTELDLNESEFPDQIHLAFKKLKKLCGASNP